MGGELNDTKEITLDDIIAWVKADERKIRELMQAEKVVENGGHGKIELIYQDGRYIGIDIQQRIRGKRCKE